MNKNVNVFLGCESGYEEAQAVIFGAPFDGTTSFRPGTRFAPEAMRSDSYAIETYSPYQNRNLSEIRVFDYGELEFPFGNTQKVLDIIEGFTNKILEDKKIPVMLGGEHLVTLGTVSAVCKKHENLRIIHFDAHTDLRDEFMGETLSHATVIRRVHDLVGDEAIYQFGIRSGEKYEFDWARKHTKLQKFSFKGLEEAVAQIDEAPVYITIDLDVLDPSVFPGTGTPEPGGVSYNDLQAAIMKLGKLKNIVGFDICELSPHYDHSGISTAAACKVLRETLLSFIK